jgi:hypothetical protein
MTQVDGKRLEPSSGPLQKMHSFSQTSGADTSILTFGSRNVHLSGRQSGSYAGFRRA